MPRRAKPGNITHKFTWSTLYRYRQRNPNEGEQFDLQS